MAEKVALQPRMNGAVFTGWTPLVVRDGGHSAHLGTVRIWAQRTAEEADAATVNEPEAPGFIPLVANTLS